MPTYSPAEDRFAAALAAIDAGDVATLEKLLRENPSLATERRDSPADGFFARPYLLWFVAEDPVRAGKLPPNIAEVAKVILRAAPHSPEELDYALMLVACFVLRAFGEGVAMPLASGSTWSIDELGASISLAPGWQPVRWQWAE